MALQCGPAIEVLEDGVGVNPAMAALDFLEPDATLLTDVPPDRVSVNMALYALLSGRSGGQRLRGGTAALDALILEPNTALAVPQVTLDPATGRVDVNPALRVVTGLSVGDGVVPLSSPRFQVGNIGTELGGFTLSQLTGSYTVGADSTIHTGQVVLGVLLNLFRTGTVLRGLRFQPSVFGGTLSELTGIGAQVNTVGGPVVLTGRMFHAISGTGTPGVGSGAVIGLEVDDLGHPNYALSFGLRIANQTASPITRLLEALGLTSTNLLVDAGDPPNAATAVDGDSACFMAWMENGAVNLRRCRWKDPGNLGANFVVGDRVMVAG